MNLFKLAAMSAVLCAANFIAPAEAQTAPPLLVPTFYTFHPYMDGQVGGSTGAGPEQRPTAPDGWNNNGLSNLMISPIGDGSIVLVMTQFVIRTDNISAIPNLGKNWNYMLIAGFPPLDTALGAGIPEFGFAGNFQGIQATSGAMPNFTVDGSSVMNDPNGSRWFTVASFFNGTPGYNCEWNLNSAPADPISFPYRCWLGNPNSSGLTPFRIVGSLWYFTSWSMVAPWIASQEAATCGGLPCVAQIDPSAPAGARVTAKVKASAPFLLAPLTFPVAPSKSILKVR